MSELETLLTDYFRTHNDTDEKNMADLSNLLNKCQNTVRAERRVEEERAKEEKRKKEERINNISKCVATNVRELFKEANIDSSSIFYTTYTDAEFWSKFVNTITTIDDYVAKSNVKVDGPSPMSVIEDFLEAMHF